MNKLSLAVPLFFAFTLSISANTFTINATCANNPAKFTGGNGGPVNITCSSFDSLGLVGQTLVSGTLNYLGDMVLDSSIYPAFADSVTISFRPDQGFASSDLVVSNADGSFLKNYNTPGPSFSSTIVSSSAVVVGVSSVGAGGSLNTPNGGSNGSVFLTYTFQPTAVSPGALSAPEPTTLSLLVFGLVGMGFGVRKRLHSS